MISELVAKFLLCAGAGIVLGAIFTGSPLALVSLLAAAAVIGLSGRGLPDDERRVLATVLTAALAVRVALVMALVVTALPQLNDLAIGSLSGDDAYYLGRAIRARDLLFGFTGGKYDYFVVLDEYGQTSYLKFLQVMQIVFGPTPFSMRLLNTVFYLAGAVLLFRIARPAFGRTAAISGLIVLLFMPSLLWVSVSLLKESMYFLCSALLLYCCARLARGPVARTSLLLAAVAGLNLWLLNDLRRGALALAIAGIGIAVVLRLATVNRTRFAVTIGVALVSAAVALSQPALRGRAVDGIESAARIHGGHVFTVGHPYKLLDDGFYKNPAAPLSWDLNLTEPQAARFLIRAGLSFLVTPWPWEMASIGELAFLPEQIIWYVLLLALPAGVAAGWRRDPAVTALLIGFAIPTAAVIAVTNGNVGTLLRLRGLVMPHLIWIGIFGLLTMAERVLARQRPPAEHAPRNWALQGPA